MLFRSAGADLTLHSVAKYPGIKTRIHAIDFAAASSADYAALGAALAPLDIGVLSASRDLAE